MTIIISRNFCDFIKRFLKFSHMDKVQNKVLFVIFGCFFVIFSAQNVFNGKLLDTDGKNVDDCIQYVIDNGEGYAVTPHHLLGRFQIQQGDNIRFFKTIEEANNFYDNSEQPRYIINNYDASWIYQAYAFQLEGCPEDYMDSAVEVKDYGDIRIYKLW